MAQRPREGQAKTGRSHRFSSDAPTCPRGSAMHVSPPGSSTRPAKPSPLLISGVPPPIPMWKRVQEGGAGGRLTSRSCWAPPKMRITPSISCSRRRAQCCTLRAERREGQGGRLVPGTAQPGTRGCPAAATPSNTREPPDSFETQPRRPRPCRAAGRRAGCPLDALREPSGSGTCRETAR